jgi:hypothetical protein
MTRHSLTDKNCSFLSLLFFPDGGLGPRCLFLARAVPGLQILRVTNEWLS